MKKVFLSAIMMIAFVGTSMANDVAEKEVEIADSKEIVIFDSQEAEISTEVVEVAFGSPSACAQLARNAVLGAAAEYGLDIRREGQHFQIMMDMYHMIYLDCYNN